MTSAHPVHKHNDPLFRQNSHGTFDTPIALRPYRSGSNRKNGQPKHHAITEETRNDEENPIRAYESLSKTNRG